MKNLVLKLGFTLVTLIFLYFYLIFVVVITEEHQERLENIIERFDYEPISKCRNMNLSFSDDEVSRFWKYNDYGICEKSESYAYFEGKELIVNCRKGKPQYTQDPEYPQRLGGMPISPVWKNTYKYRERSEFVIVRCSKKQRDHFVFVFNKYKEEVSKNAFSKASKYNKTLNSPFTVLVLLFDSVSRGSAYMNWPKTMEFLNNLEGSGTNFIDFEIPTTIGINTRPNMIPVLYGQSEDFHNEYLRDSTFTTLWPSSKYLLLQKDAIWSYYSSLGYTTMFLYDTKFDFLVQSLGRIIKADHVFTNFWRLAYRIFDFHDFSEKQRCMGQEDSHYYSLSYTLQYLKNYKNNNRFAYVHLDAAHENTGNVRTVDKDLVEFLREMIKWYQKKNQYFTIFLLGDHGRINPVLQFNIKGYIDQRTPMTFVISSDYVISQWSAQNILKKNTKELVGRYDIHLSLKDIAHFPYERITNSSYLQLKAGYPVDDVVSLFREPISESRKCSDIGSSSMYCNCKDYKITEKIGFDAEVVNMISELGKVLVDNIERNSENCKKSAKFSVVESKKFELSPYSRGWETLFKVRIKVDKTMYLNGFANFCKYSKVKRSKHALPIEEYPATIFTVNNTEVYVQLVKFDLESGCKENYCICKKPSLLPDTVVYTLPDN